MASSYCPQHKVSGQIEEAVVEFDTEEKAHLGKDMPPQSITLCEDETFHPEICRVAIEPVSNFILLEKDAESRKAQAWTDAMKEATDGLAVEIVQSTSDEGSGLLHHVNHDRGVHHSPDVFHVHHELVKGTSIVLAKKAGHAGRIFEEACEDVNRHIHEKKLYRSEKHGPGRPPEFDTRSEHAREQEDVARTSFETAIRHQQCVKDAVQGISQAYHPYDCETGGVRSAQEVSASILEHFSAIETVAAEANLSDRCLKNIKKAKNVVVDMVATLVFFLQVIHAKVEALSLAPDVERAVYDNLIPAIYVRLVSEKAKSAESRKTLREKSEELLAPLRARHGPFTCLGAEEKVVIEGVAEECAQVFQRSSSCVEGRNGQ